MCEKLVKANKCLHVIRTLRQQGYNQEELNYLFQSIVMPNFLYGLSVNGASSSDLNNVQHFLDKCYKRRYISRKLNIWELHERSDCRIFRKALSTNSPLVKILPERNFHPLHTKKTMLLSSLSGKRAFQIVLCE